MFPPGHAALGVHLVHRLPRLVSRPAAVAALLTGTLTPDLLDKSLQWAGVYPWGRTWGHSLVGNVLLASLSLLLWTLVQLSTRAGTAAAGQDVAHQPVAASIPAGVDSAPDAAWTPAPADPSLTAQASADAEMTPSASASLPTPDWTNRLRTTAALLTCLTIGQWSHVVADLWTDVEQGAMHTGYLWSAWIAWPWMTPDDLPWTMSPWLPSQRWITFSEAIVVILALRLFLVRQRRTFPPTGRVAGATPDETVG